MLTRVAAALICCGLAFGGAIACSSASPRPVRPYGAQGGWIGDSLALLGWNMSVANLRWDTDRVLVDISASVAAPQDPKASHAKAQDIRFGLYGALLHPIEAPGLGSCEQLDPALPGPRKPEPAGVSLSVSGNTLTGTVCLGPLTDHSQVRGVYVYSPRDRIPDSSAAYAAAFPVGVPEINGSDTGIALKTISISAWRADGTPVTTRQLGDPAAFTGNGYMLLGVQASAVAARYRDDALARGGPMMLLAAPTLPGRGLSPACSAYGSSVLILPEVSQDAVLVNASLCTQGEINDALLYATLAVAGTHAAVWTLR